MPPIDDSHDDPLAAQYEAYPYPARDPAEERKRLILGSPSDLREVVHYLRHGRFDPGQPFRALVAGGGSGDAAIMLAQQLADEGATAAEVVYLDLSRTSRAIAEARAKVRGLTNLRFHTGSLEAVAEIAPGPYDYIDCCGVLHHLADPPTGLAALRAQLAPDGGMGIMVYAPYGRSGVYELQGLLRQLVSDRPLPEQVALARRLVAKLPETNRLRRNPYLSDHKQSDAALVDLLLNLRDRAYRVEDLLYLLKSADLRAVSFIAPTLYAPETYANDPKLATAFAALSPEARWQAAESLAGNIRLHIVYAAPTDSPAGEAVISDVAVPLLTKNSGPELARAAQQDLSIKATIAGLALRRRLPRLAPAILSRIDGKRSLGEIRADLQAANPAVTDEAFKEAFAETYGALQGLNLLLLRYPGI
ncbi:MAG: class I SAM-dependent methyltransferase [Pseudomonadota bacterium]